MKRLEAAVLILVGLAGTVYADEFSAAAKHIESHYQVRRTDPHLIGFGQILANPAVAGNESNRLKIASFKNENFAFKPSLLDLDRIMTASLSTKWQPLLRLSSRAKGTATTIYVKPSGEAMQLLIGSIESNEIGLAEIEVTAKDIRRLIANPKGNVKEAASANKETD
jgi:hypothetical protein